MPFGRYLFKTQKNKNIWVNLIPHLSGFKLKYILKKFGYKSGTHP